jgi:DNA-binding MarR family transcriptional regulator
VNCTEGEEKAMDATARAMSGNISRCFHLLLEVLARKSTRTLTKYLRRNDIPPRLYEIMTFISSTPQNQTTIAESLHINKNVMVRLIDELEQRGLCLRVQKAGFRRREYNIQLTAKGANALRDCEKSVRESERELLSGLAEAEQQELCKLLEKSLETELNR